MLVFKDINQRKFSSALTLLAISLGILIIFVIFLLGQGFENSIEEQFNQLGSNRIYITSATTNIGSTDVTKGLTDNEINLIESKPYVKRAHPYYFKPAQIQFGREYVQGLIIGTHITQEFLDDINLEVDQGRIPKSNERFSVILGPKAASDMFDKEIQLGSNIYLKDTKFKVVGILKSIGNPQDDSNLYFDIETLRDIYDDGNNVGYIDVIIEENYDITIAEENLKTLLENKLGKDTVVVIAPTALLEQVSGILDIVKFTLGGIAFVALIVGAIGIINTMFVIITEKTKDIGIMKSIGATNSDILFIYIFQAGFFGFLGSVFGVVFGSLAAKAFESFAQSYGFTFLTISILPSNVISLLVFGFAIGTVAGFIPAYKASKINIIEAIRK